MRSSQPNRLFRVRQRHPDPITDGRVGRFEYRGMRSSSALLANGRVGCFD